jgi:hypothetical protein
VEAPEIAADVQELAVEVGADVEAEEAATIGVYVKRHGSS